MLNHKKHERRLYKLAEYQALDAFTRQDILRKNLSNFLKELDFADWLADFVHVIAEKLPKERSKLFVKAIVSEFKESEDFYEKLSPILKQLCIMLCGFTKYHDIVKELELCKDLFETNFHDIKKYQVEQILANTEISDDYEVRERQFQHYDTWPAYGKFEDAIHTLMRFTLNDKFDRVDLITVINNFYFAVGADLIRKDGYDDKSVQDEFIDKLTNIVLREIQT